MIKNWRNTGLAVAANMRRACAPNPPFLELAKTLGQLHDHSFAACGNMRRACSPNPSLFKLAPILPRNYSLRGAKPSRWRLIVGCLLSLQVSIHAASPAFSYSGELDSYLASKFIVPIADSHRQQYMRQAGLPSGMLRYYEPHPWGTGPHPFSSYCCNQQDCGFAKPGSVTWTPDGYRVMMPDGEIQMVPEDSPAIRFQYEKGHEKEARFAACIMQKGAAIDAYLNNLSPGAVESPSAWYVRCLYIGRSGQ